MYMREYKIKVENLMAFCEPAFTEEGEKFLEYHVCHDYELIINNKKISHIYQDDYRVDKVEIFLTDGNESLPFSLGDDIEVYIILLKRKNFMKPDFTKRIIANIIGCGAGAVVQRRVNQDEDNSAEYQISKVAGRGEQRIKYNDIINPVQIIDGLQYTIIDYEDRIEVNIKNMRNILQKDMFM
jgi:hypothetical protein